jgi:hypothetical protein
MTKKEREVHVDNLTDCVMVEANIECEECSKYEYDYDEVELAKKVFSLGWRYINGRALCRKCAKKEKK